MNLFLASVDWRAKEHTFVQLLPYLLDEIYIPILSHPQNRILPVPAEPFINKPIMKSNRGLLEGPQIGRPLVQVWSCVYEQKNLVHSCVLSVRK